MVTKAIDKSLELLVGELLYPYQVEVYRLEHMRATTIKAEYGGLGKQLAIDDSHLMSAVDPAMIVVEETRNIRIEMRKALHDKYGDYPEVRVWALENFQSTALLCHFPEEEIPGWVWPKWNRDHPNKRAIKTGGYVIKGSVEDQEEKEMAAKAKRKVVVVQKGAKTKKEPNKPYCPVHKAVQMKFNAVRGVFECQDTSCNLIARPKTEQPEGQVILGKGNLELRLVYTGQDKEVAVVLQSDNNVALDITKYVDLSVLIAKFAVNSRVQEAQRQGLSVVRTPVNDVPLHMALAILGVDNA